MPALSPTQIIKRREKARHRRCRRDGDCLRMAEVGGLGNFRSGATVEGFSRPTPYRKAYHSSRDTAEGDEDASLSSERHNNAT